MIRTSDIFIFNYKSLFFVFVPNTPATGNCNCGAHHLTTAEVLKFLRYELLYLQKFTKLSEKKKKHSLLLLLIVSLYRATGNCNCGAHYLPAEVLN